MSKQNQILDKDMLRDAISIISEYESPETFADAEKLAKAVSLHFDAEVKAEDVKDFVRPCSFDSVDRYLTLKNIGY